MSECCKSCKNPCMVCKRTVTTKTGLQCQGSCKSWIHFTCCSYTPGKIKDIKAKIIKVRCPCPDCATQGPKEVIVKDSSFTCINKICPSNNPPKCMKRSVPKVCQQTSMSAPSGAPSGNSHFGGSPPKCELPKIDPWPGMPCGGTTCKMHAQDEGDQCRPTPCPGPPPHCPPPPPCPPPHCPPPPCPPPPCPPSPPRTSPPATPVMPSISIVENMCETVGVLSDQLNQLMSKMTEVLAPKGGGTPCRCPQNPKR